MKLRRFTLVYLAIIVAIIIVSALVQILADFDITNAGMALIPAMGASMVEGQAFAKAENRMPDTSEMWGFARRASVVILGLILLSAVAFSLALPELQYMVSQPYGALFVAGALLFQTVMSFLLVRFFLASGAKSVLRARDRQEGRG
ncbi:ABZJ_00895 family protein [Tritonibacter scottomollicae]|uniref:ABZJ_00895 family protein n=1 Tax=Tritonibacter scottomollicae TaxID=483013 RepID=UPI003AA97DEE